MKRAFIVGNGPSLNRTPLEKLIGETSFGVNGIAAIYDRTPWRPTHYVRAEEASTGSDSTVWQRDMEIHRDLGCEIWANEMFVRGFNDIQKSGQWRQIRACAHYTAHFDSSDAPHFYHLPRLCTFGSTVNVAIQIALGIHNFDVVYLVGCDMGYLTNAPRHFDANYTARVGELREARYTELDILAAHMICAREFRGRIFNATVGGFLEVYPRVNFESLFETVTPVSEYVCVTG